MGVGGEKGGKYWGWKISPAGAGGKVVELGINSFDYFNMHC